MTDRIDNQEHKFQINVLERLARIEANGAAITKEIHDIRRYNEREMNYILTTMSVHKKESEHADSDLKNAVRNIDEKVDRETEKRNRQIFAVFGVILATVFTSFWNFFIAAPK